LVRLGSSIFGLVLLALGAATLLVTWARQRDDQQLNQTVRDLKQRAQSHAASLQRQLDVPINVAIARMQKDGAGIGVALAYFSTAIPEDFFDESTSFNP
jgi:hypothetical protein